MPSQKQKSALRRLRTTYLHGHRKLLLLTLGAVLLIGGTFVALALRGQFVQLGVDFSDIKKRVDPTDIGIGVSTYGANALMNETQRNIEHQLDARHVRIPVGYRDGKVTSSATGGSTDLDIPALVALYRDWGYSVMITLGDRTNDADIQPGDAAAIIRALGTEPGISYSAPNEMGNLGKSTREQIDTARMIVREGKAIDSGFKLWGPVDAYYDRDNIKAFARALGDDLAGISYHHYGMGETSLSTATAMEQTSAYVREITDIKADMTALGRDVPVRVDELNFSWRVDDGTPGGNDRFFTATNTVWIASALGHILTAGGQGLPYATQAGALGMMIEPGEFNPDSRPASSPMPGYWGIAAYTGGGIWPHFKDSIYASTSSDTTSEIIALNNEAGGHNVVAINKSEHSKTTELRLEGISEGTYQLYQSNPKHPYDAPKLLRETEYTPDQPVIFTMPAQSISILVVSPSPR